MQIMQTGQAVPISPILPSAIIASSMFTGKYLLIYHLRDTLPSLTEIFEILMVKIFEMKSLNKTGRSMNQKIQIWHGLEKTTLRVVNSHAPFRTKLLNGKTPQIDSALKKGMRCRDTAKRKAIKIKNPQDWGNYRKLRNRINNKVKTTKTSYYHNSFIQSKNLYSISARFIRECADIISGPLCDLFNKSLCLVYFLTTGNVPE